MTNQTVTINIHAFDNKGKRLQKRSLQPIDTETMFFLSFDDYYTMRDMFQIQNRQEKKMDINKKTATMLISYTFSKETKSE